MYDKGGWEYITYQFGVHQFWQLFRNISLKENSLTLYKKVM